MKLLVSDLSLKGQKVLLRVDFNVPINKSGEITDDTRIRAALPTIKYITEHGGKLIILSHLGRPKGTKNKEYTLEPCAKRLSQLLGKPVTFVPDCIGEQAEQQVKDLKDGAILLMENLRFYPGEEDPKSHPDFVKQLAKLGDVYVNDAFGTAHREHASTTTIAKFFPNKAAAGFLMQKELQFLGHLLHHTQRPFYAIIGGAKISSKIGVLKALLKKVDALFIGGAMAYTFFKAQGLSIGNSLHEEDYIEEAKSILTISQNSNIPIYLPKDQAIVKEIKANQPYQIVKSIEGIPNGYQAVDIGPETVVEYAEKLKDAKTIFWNGPLGVFEIPPFDKGTNAIAHLLAELKDTTTVVGGGESVAAVEAAGLADQMTHLSTGGGASLEYLEFGTLPGIEALSDVNNI